MNRVIRSVAISLFISSGLGCAAEQVSSFPEETIDSSPPNTQNIPVPPPDQGSDTPPPPDSGSDDVPPNAPDLRRSGGCDQADYDSGSQPRFFNLDGTQRRYQVQLPEGYDSALAYPVLFSLHGLNETGDNARQRFNGVITDDAIQLFPDGEGEQWNNTTDMEFIDGLLTQIQDEYCVDPARVFAAGFSAGGGGTHAIGCYLGDRFRGIAPIAGTGTFTECEGRVAVMQIQGTSDFVAREEAAMAVREHWLYVNQCDGAESMGPSTHSQCEESVGCMADYPTLYCEHSRGHEWPTWASEVIWDFFVGLEPILPGADPDEDNDGILGSSVTFTLDIPVDFDGVPRKVAPILYGPNTFQPIFTAPSLILNNGKPVGDEFVLGEQVQYEIEPINLLGLDLPADFTFTVVVYVEGGGDPTPCGKDWIGLQQVTIEDTGDFVVEEPLELEPFWAIPFFFDCPE